MKRLKLFPKTFLYTIALMVNAVANQLSNGLLQQNVSTNEVRPGQGVQAEIKDGYGDDIVIAVKDDNSGMTPCILGFLPLFCTEPCPFRQRLSRFNTLPKNRSVFLYSAT